ncbi:hypothetical protein CUMW_094060 [Citrus unshiu]|uniref:Shikimate O-hydroxycinnamoyltransferase n=1 Tax=Citrus unshiu TaxID=55188 RepID=A0A2H5P124_CITUN|nr:hypothetical protein CUMW_094060 [Citrus unshiu]
MEINVKESTIIRPAHETPEQCLQISDLDMLVPTVHAPGVYFYRRPSDSSNFFEAGLLKEALNNVLVRFYPMAGRLGRDENGVIHIQCNGEGALFVVAETSCVIDDFGEFESGLKLLNFVPNVDYSSNDISSYPLLLAQVRGLPDDQASKLLIPINGRSRLNPELPSGYIGNVLFTGTSIALSGDILSEPLNFTAERIHKALMRMDDEYLKSALAYLKQQPDLSVLKRGAHTFKCPNVNVSNLFHMPIYDANFGSGRPLFFRPIVLFDGLTHILPGPSNDGSLYLVTNLETRYIPLFKKSFYEIFAS